MDRVASRTLFAHVVARPEDDLELDVAALLAGEWEYAGLDVARYLSELDRLAEDARAALDAGPGLEPVSAINAAMFETGGFRGNDEDYYDPRNSFLNEVLDRRTGIPITLSVVYLEVARRLGVAMNGVSFPGHFLVRHDVGDGSMIIVDPFQMGRLCSLDSLRELLHQAAGGRLELSAELLEPAAKRDILVRMLSNLASIYRQRCDVDRSIEVLQRILILDPERGEVERELHRLRRQAGEVN